MLIPRVRLQRGNTSSPCFYFPLLNHVPVPVYLHVAQEETAAPAPGLTVISWAAAPQRMAVARAYSSPPLKRESLRHAFVSAAFRRLFTSGCFPALISVGSGEILPQRAIICKRRATRGQLQRQSFAAGQAHTHQDEFAVSFLLPPLFCHVFLPRYTSLSLEGS